jgi:hypothetical protein
MLDDQANVLAFRNRMLTLSVARTTAFARASTAYQTNQDGSVTLLGVNVLRNANYVNGVGPSTLYEPNPATNLVNFPEDFSNAAWAKTGGGAGSAPVVTPNAAVAPDGNMTADQVVFVAPGNGDRSILTQDGVHVIPAATQHAGSFYVMALGAGDIGKVLIFRQVGRAAYTPVTLTAAWQRVSSVEVSSNTASYIEIGLRPVVGGGSSGTVSVLLWGADLELGSAATSYTPNTRAADVDSLFSATATGYARATGSFLTEGFADGMEFLPAGFADNTIRVIDSVSALTITTKADAARYQSEGTGSIPQPTVEAPLAGRSFSVGNPVGRAFDNKRLKPATGRPYTEEDYVPGASTLLGQKTGGYVYEEGLYVIKISGLENKGTGAIRRWVNAMKALFAPGTVVFANGLPVRVRDDATVKSSQILPQGNGWAVCTVTVPWRAESVNQVAA